MELPYTPIEFLGLVELSGPSAPMALKIEFGLNSFSLRSPRYSALELNGKSERRTASRIRIGHLQSWWGLHLTRKAREELHRWPCRGRTYGPLIKSPSEELPQATQHNESSAKEWIRDGTGHHRSWCVRVFWHQRGTKAIAVIAADGARFRLFRKV